MNFRIVDAFTKELFGGNPAGVVVIPSDCDFPPEEMMQKTAAELRYSETAFVKKLGDGKYKTRYFTPVAEVELCGHATIGTFYALYEMGELAAGDVVENDTLSGLLKIQVEEGQILMDMAEPKMHFEITEEDQLTELYQVMGISKEKQGVLNDDADTYLYPRAVSTGLIDLILPVKDEEALESIQPDFPALTELSRKYNIVAVHAITCNAKDGKIHARDFAPLYAVNEEAATGTASGALTYYLYTYDLLKVGDGTTILQGEAMDRPSVIMTKITEEKGEPKIQVGGPAVILAEGDIKL